MKWANTCCYHKSDHSKSNKHLSYLSFTEYICLQSYNYSSKRCKAISKMWTYFSPRDGWGWLVDGTAALTLVEGLPSDLAHHLLAAALFSSLFHLFPLLRGSLNSDSSDIVWKLRSNLRETGFVDVNKGAPRLPSDCSTAVDVPSTKLGSQWNGVVHSSVPYVTGLTRTNSSIAHIWSFPYDSPPLRTIHLPPLSQRSHSIYGNFRKISM